MTPTRGNSILDLVFTTNPTLVKSSISIPGVSDHDLVCTDFNTKPEVIPQKTRTCYKYKQADWEQMRKDMVEAAQVIEEAHKAGKDVNILWTTFKTLLTNSITRNIPSFTLRKTSSLPWLTAPLRALLKRKSRLFHRARVSKDWSTYRKFQKHCRNELRRAEWKHINNTIVAGLDQNDTKPFWRYIK